MPLLAHVAAETKLVPARVQAVLSLLDENHTVPFIARYRKELTGNCDEVEIAAIEDSRRRFVALESRRQAILASLRERGLESPQLSGQIEVASSLSVLEDLYLPFRPKRRTRASIARDAGYEPLAKDLWEHRAAPSGTSPEALAGALDIVAERLSELPALRSTLREYVRQTAVLVVKAARGSPEGSRFHAHVGRSGLIRTVPGYRLLAVLRGEKEGQIKFSLEIDGQRAVELVHRGAGWGRATGSILDSAAEDAWNRLLEPSLENEVLQEARARAELQALEVFSANLHALLLSPPLGQKRVLALDPGFRTGIKAAVLSAEGDLREHGVIYPLEPHCKTTEAASLVRGWVKTHRLEAIAVGNGTGGQEAFVFVQNLGLGIPVFSVNESGASVYSASSVARQEFPDLDLTVRGAVSIGRRLIDPMAELVKIDPQSIGVGQYQHDVDAAELERYLARTVVSCVNKVGVEVNTATASLLAYVAGLNPKLAAKVVEHRRKNGPFRSRWALRDVSGFGPKAFEQSAGFLRVQGGPQVLDTTAVHPESYPQVEELARKVGLSIESLVGSSNLRTRFDEWKGYWAGGEQTLRDVLAELEKPGLDPRPALDSSLYQGGLHTIGDLLVGQVVQGAVTNVTDFGAFVDLGVHQDGLIHISELSNQYVKHPLDVVQVGQRIEVKVLAVDVDRKRISLSKKGV